MVCVIVIENSVCTLHTAHWESGIFRATVTTIDQCTHLRNGKYTQVNRLQRLLQLTKRHMLQRFGGLYISLVRWHKAGLNHIGHWWQIQFAFKNILVSAVLLRNDQSQNIISTVGFYNRMKNSTQAKILIH